MQIKLREGDTLAIRSFVLFPHTFPVGFLDSMWLTSAFDSVRLESNFSINNRKKKENGNLFLSSVCVSTCDDDANLFFPSFLFFFFELN